MALLRTKALSVFIALSLICIPSASFAADLSRLRKSSNRDVCQSNHVKVPLRSEVRASLHENFRLEIEPARREAFTQKYEKVVGAIIESISIEFSQVEASDISVRDLRICKAKITIAHNDRSFSNLMRYAVKLGQTVKEKDAPREQIEIQLLDLPVTSVIKAVDVLMTDKSTTLNNKIN